MKRTELNSNPKISIIVPYYNMSKYFLDTLKSIKEQTYDNWECIIINDGSTDNDRDLILDNIKNDTIITIDTSIRTGQFWNKNRYVIMFHKI